MTKKNLKPIAKEHGQVDAHSPAALKEAGNKALSSGDDQRAAHMYTLGIDMIAGQDYSKMDASDWFQLDGESDGVLHALLSNRSFAHLKQKDYQAAGEDAEYCCLAKPDFAKGHLRLLAALKEGDMPIEERRRACTRGLNACPTSKELLEQKVLLDTEVGKDVATANACAAAESRALREQVSATHAIADDANDPRHAMAAGDIGSLYAVGAHGLKKDLIAAEKYLKIASDGDDVPSQRNYGLLLIELGRAVEAAEQLNKAASQGDEQATDVLKTMGDEADQKRKAAMFQLQALADKGDERAIGMLKELALTEK